MRTRRIKRAQYMLMGALISLAGLTTLAMAGETSSVVLGTRELQRIAQQVRQFKPKDKFDAPPQVSSLTGRHFSVIVTPRSRGPSNKICKGFPSWGYDTRQQKFEVSFNNGSILVDGYMNVAFAAAFAQSNSISSSFLRFASFTCKHTNEGSYLASNAFGATVRVQKERDVVIAFSAQSEASRIPITETTYWSQTIAGDAARELSTNVAVRITGVIGLWPNGQNIICGVKHDPPSLDFAYEKTLDACIFKARSIKFEVINRKMNAVLFSTDAESAQPRS